jgi:hypothetical protein
MEMLLLRLSYLDRTVQLEALLRGLGGEEPSVLSIPRKGPSEQIAVPAPVADTEVDLEPPKGPSSLREAWDQVLANPGSLPKGVLPFLRAARTEFSEGGEVNLFLLPGPGLERLQEPVVLLKLKEALGRYSDSAPDVSVQADGPEDGPAGRITEGTIRGGRLKELVDKEPALGEAVKELDLELLD